LFGRLVGGGHAFVSLGEDDSLKVEVRADSEQPLLENG
jgi:ATP-dependent Clp protease ATP-binding subunit ClpA